MRRNAAFTVPCPLLRTVPAGINMTSQQQLTEVFT